LRGNWQDFNWHDASRGPSAIAERTFLVPAHPGSPWRVGVKRMHICIHSLSYFWMWLHRLASSLQASCRVTLVFAIFYTYFLVSFHLFLAIFNPPLLFYSYSIHILFLLNQIALPSHSFIFFFSPLLLYASFHSRSRSVRPLLVTFFSCDREISGRWISISNISAIWFNSYVYRYRVGQKSKLLILSEHVNKAEKTGGTWTNTNSFRENEALSDIFTWNILRRNSFMFKYLWLMKAVNEITARQTRTSLRKHDDIKVRSMQYLTT